VWSITDKRLGFDGVFQLNDVNNYILMHHESITKKNKKSDGDHFRD